MKGLAEEKKEKVVANAGNDVRKIAEFAVEAVAVLAVFYKVHRLTEYSYDRGPVSMGSMGLAKPINFWRRVLEPINFWQN